MTFEDILLKYKPYAKQLDYDIVWTPRLGWIAIALDFKSYSEPVRQFSTPEELARFIETRIR